MPPLQFITAASVDIPDREAAEAAVKCWRDAGGNVFLYSYTHAGICYFVFPDLATFVFDPDSVYTKVVPVDSLAHALVEDTYWRSVMPLILQLKGFGALHASGIETPTGVIALCASSGTGKSTLASAFAARGYDLWADDAVVFDAADSEAGPSTLALPFRLRLRHESAAFLGAAQLSRDSSTYLQRAFSKGSASSLPLRALFVLQRDDTLMPPVACERLAATEALEAVLSHAYALSLDEVGQRRRLMQQYLGLVAQVPIFQLRFRPDLSRLDQLVGQIRSAVEAEQPPG